MSRSAAGSTAAAAAREAVAKMRRARNCIFIREGEESGKFWIYISFHSLLSACLIHLQCLEINLCAGMEKLG